MDGFRSYLLSKESWLAYLVVPAIAILAGILISWMLLSLLRFSNKKRPSELKRQLLFRMKKPTFYLIPLLLLRPVISYFSVELFWEKVLEALIIFCFAWVLIGLVLAVEEVIKEKFSMDGDYVASERKALTQLRFLKSMAMVVIITIAVSAVLWNIPSARQLGSTILTSAGVLGIIIGVAAQKSISNLIVGLQMAFTQALKIDDEVVIEGEFGNVEDITLTYVVVRTWDWRRLVLPLNYFNDKPFVNWTFNSRPLIASVYLYVDYTLPVEELRDKLKEILAHDERWDKNIADFEVTDTNNRTMEVRASFSVENATDAWSLRCKVREVLVAYIKENYPGALPKLRRTEASLGAS
ncbi:mechanosensitive ion channel [Muricauda sp. JGD-17]|uniref:Mechanosensitive ion channel n=1 Tax=Flagellimonas ochracea TaxID=2696472 RepID=A0A964WWR7_9FLAO|nr:mechanosensitive ion channel domain-containing protein [Allomuricauda ochracea]NAY91361.1 mechanosensitive ion channel [Allomuricauda ochracea]